MACACGPGQVCQPLKPGCWGYQDAKFPTWNPGIDMTNALTGTDDSETLVDWLRRIVKTKDLRVRGRQPKWLMNHARAAAHRSPIFAPSVRHERSRPRLVVRTRRTGSSARTGDPAASLHCG